MKVQEVLQRTTQHFQKKGFESARLDAELLISHGLGWERIDLYSKFDYPMSEEELTKCRELVARRNDGEPVAYILGSKEFFGREFAVNSSVLIPRPETEVLCERVLDYLIDSELGGDVVFRILDMGAGSGCIGLTLLKEIERRRICQAELMSVDISPKALEVSKENAKRHDVEEQCRWFQMDLLSGEAHDLLKSEMFDLIVANPPYIAEGDKALEENVKKFEPKEALIAKDEGFQCLKSWAQLAEPRLNMGGHLFFELGFQQGEPFKQWLEKETRFIDIQLHKDLAGIPRVIEARRPMAGESTGEENG